MTTRAPCSLNSFAVASPMPEFPPVTTATLPSSFPIFFAFLNRVLQTHIGILSCIGHAVFGVRWLGTALVYRSDKVGVFDLSKQCQVTALQKMTMTTVGHLTVPRHQMCDVNQLILTKR